MAETAEETKKESNILGVEGVLMLTIGIMLDFACGISVILIFLFGVGLLLAKIVYIVGLIIVTVWTIFRSGSLPGKGKLEEKIKNGLMDFFKKHGKKMAIKVVPVFGDAIPFFWTYTIYSELKSE